MSSKQPTPGLRGIKNIGSAGIRSLPRTHRSGYLDLYVLGREKGRLEKEIFTLDAKRTGAAEQLANVVKRIITLQKETGEKEHVKPPENIPGPRAKRLKTVVLEY
ncbi:MAG: hypothetical protein KKH28_01800 [Elusimicrobia bacterium]|nr:hypothetical protein [Elusimicrobiota bacterium]